MWGGVEGRIQVPPETSCVGAPKARVTGLVVSCLTRELEPNSGRAASALSH